MEKLKLVSTGSSDRTGQSDIEGSSVRRGESILSGEQTVEQAYNELRDEYKVKLCGMSIFTDFLEYFLLVATSCSLIPLLGCPLPAFAIGSMPFLPCEL
jgi:hypothetical protein